MAKPRQIMKGRQIRKTNLRKLAATIENFEIEHLTREAFNGNTRPLKTLRQELEKEYNLAKEKLRRPTDKIARTAFREIMDDRFQRMIAIDNFLKKISKK